MPEDVQFRATVDIATKERIREINLARAKLKAPALGLNALMEECVLWVREERTRMVALRKFFTDTWPEFEPANGEISRSLQLKWWTGADSAAVDLAEFLGTNKSKTMRALIAFVVSRRFGIKLRRVYPQIRKAA